MSDNQAVRQAKNWLDEMYGDAQRVKAEVSGPGANHGNRGTWRGNEDDQDLAAKFRQVKEHMAWILDWVLKDKVDDKRAPPEVRARFANRFSVTGRSFADLRTLFKSGKAALHFGCPNQVLLEEAVEELDGFFHAMQ